MIRKAPKPIDLKSFNALWADDLVQQDPQKNETTDDDLFKETGLRISSINDIRTVPPLKYIVEDIIIQGFIYFLSGPPGVGKSILANSLAKSIATGQPFLNAYKIHKPGLVLFVDSENPSPLLQQRFDKMGIPNDLPIEFLHFQDIRLDEEGRIDKLLRVIDHKKPVMTIFDSLIRFHCQKENDPDGMRIVSDGLRSISECGSTVLALHHSPVKSTQTHISRGSGEIPAGCDIEYGMVKKSKGIIDFRSYKSRVEPLNAIQLKIISTSGVLGIEMAGTHIDHKRLNRVKAQLEAHVQQGDNLPNQTEFTKLIKRLYPDLKGGSIATLIQEGVTEGYWIQVVGGKNNAKQYKPV